MTVTDPKTSDNFDVVDDVGNDLLLGRLVTLLTIVNDDDVDVDVRR